MGYTEIAIAKPFEGAPVINLPGVYGASCGKGILLRVPVTGERPVNIKAEGLPEGLFIENGVIKGSVNEKGNYTVKITAENRLGINVKEFVLEIGESINVLLTPLMGFTTWNAFASAVSQEKLEYAADKLVELGICEYGYSYINLDSGWQKEYGGKYDAIMPNEKFPDIKAMYDKIHSYGLKGGIYSTPMLTAWGCPAEFESIPGCTTGEPNELFSHINGGIGTERKEKNNVKQWCEWGVDYLKYDWTPCDPYNAELMRSELAKSDRDFGYCVTIGARRDYFKYWSKYCNSYRDNEDSLGYWDNFKKIFMSYLPFATYMTKGHFFDLDMFDIGDGELLGECKYTEDEKASIYTLRAITGSPLQISCYPDAITDFDLSLYCNEEVIAINQDTAFKPAIPYHMIEKEDKCIYSFKRELCDGSFAVAIFNLGEHVEPVCLYLDADAEVRDVWAKKDYKGSNVNEFRMQPHTVRMFKVKQ